MDLREFLEKIIIEFGEIIEERPEEFLLAIKRLA